jgi:motility quorum-sensing regulator / GCU-specific mRNA interferase toxin
MFSKPTYDLVLIKQLVDAGSYHITGVAFHGAGELGLDESDVEACVRSLDSTCFYKTMPAKSKPDLWQDVYRPTFEGYELYVKLQLVGEHPDQMCVVISFKRR